MSDPRQAHRCAPCDVNWPFMKAYLVCPLCASDTWIVANEKPLSLDECRTLLTDIEEAKGRRAAFDDYYARGRDLLTCAACWGANTVVDETYSICEVCDRPDPALTLDTLGGWDESLAGELPSDAD